MISALRPSVGRFLSEPIVNAIARTGVSPNALTITGFLFSAVTAWFLAEGHLLAGGLMVLFSAWFDMLDGALAKIKQRTTRFGALLDSSLDRVSEAALFLGLLLFYADRHDTGAQVLIYAALVGSFMVSYIRARADSLGIDAEVGILARPERVVLLALGLLLTEVWSDALVAVLWVLAVGTNLTALRRLLYSRQQCERDR